MTKNSKDNAPLSSKPADLSPAAGERSEATLPDPASAGPGKTLLDSAERQAQIEALQRERQALEETAARYRAILDASPDPICLTRLEDGKYIFVNTAFYERTGFTPEQIAKYTSIELNVYTGPGERNRLINRLKRDGRVENMEMTIRDKSGAIVSDLWSLRIIDYAGEPHLLLIARNYSQLRAAQQALMESEASYRSILESTPYAIVVTRLADSHYMQVNEAFCRLTGYSRDETGPHARRIEDLCGPRRTATHA
jgi:PAS domain S-box-containing protein